MTFIPASAPANLTQYAWRIVICGLFAALLTVPFTYAVLGINFGTTFLDRGPIRERILDAYKTGELNVDLEAPAGQHRGLHQYNDCLIMAQVIQEGGTKWQRALSPHMLLEDPQYYTEVAPEGDALVGRENPCKALLDYAQADVGEVAPGAFYHRYMHGHTALAAVTLSVLPLDKVRQGLVFFALAATVGLIAAAGVTMWRAVARANSAQASRSLFVGVAGIVFLLFYAFGDFGMSFGHFPTDIALIAYLWLALFMDMARWRPWVLIAIHAMFGVVTAWFEFITGGIPLGACLVLYMGAAQVGAKQQGLESWRVTACIVSFGVGLVFAFVVKITATYFAFGPQILTDFLEGLRHRMAGATGGDLGNEHIGVMHSVNELFEKSGRVATGWRGLGKVLALGSVLAVAYSVFLMIRRRLTGDALVQPLLLLSAFLTICLWHVLFYPHTYVHAWFMVRTLVGLYFTSVMLLACVHRDAISRFMGKAGALVPLGTAPAPSR